jgi:archaellum component FlaC
MELQTQNFIENVDAWIKQIRGEFSEITDVSNIVEENNGNIQHNYELIHELKDEIDSLKKELGALKLLQLVSLKHKRHV